MRSALYFPHTEIRSEGLFTTALLLWDQVHVLVPWDGYQPSYKNKDHAMAFELIGKCHAPSQDEKKQAHEFVEDFATRPLPDAFSYTSVTNPSEVYEVYPQKFRHDTWDVLMKTGLSGGSLPNLDMPMSAPAGLSLMSILADCCAGQTLARITDRGAAYASLAGLLAQESDTEVEAQGATERLSALTIQVIDTAGIPLKKLIGFRENEVKSASGHALRGLRHRYLDRLSTQASNLIAARKKSDRAEIERQFKQEMVDDLKELRSELRLSAGETLGSKDVVISVVAGVGAVVAPLIGMPVPDVVSASGAAAIIGGLLSLRSKFAKSRYDILKKHPMAYLYEMKGGLRL